MFLPQVHKHGTTCCKNEERIAASNSSKTSSPILHQSFVASLIVAFFKYSTANICCGLTRQLPPCYRGENWRVEMLCGLPRVTKYWEKTSWSPSSWPCASAQLLLVELLNHFWKGTWKCASSVGLLSICIWVDPQGPCHLMMTMILSKML